MVSASSLESWLLNPTQAPLNAIRFAGLDDIAKALFISKFSESTLQPTLLVFNQKSTARNAIDNLKFFLGEKNQSRIHYLPPWDFDFYRGVLPNPDTITERGLFLSSALKAQKNDIFITTVSALLQKTLKKEVFLAAVKTLRPNDEIDREVLTDLLLNAGFQKQPTVYDPGVFSVRGGIVDIFCPLYPNPVRIEFYGDLIDEIRFFDSKTQVSKNKTECLDIIPIGMSLIPQGIQFEEAREQIKVQLDRLDIPKNKRDEIIDNIRNGHILSEYGFLFPILSSGSGAVLDYFPEKPIIFWDGYETIRESLSETEIPRLKKNHSLYVDNGTPIAAYDSLFEEESAIQTLLKAESSRFFEAFSVDERTDDTLIKSDFVTFTQERQEAKNRQSHLHFEPFVERFKKWMEIGTRIHLVCHTRTHAERLQALLLPHGVSTAIHSDENNKFQDILSLPHQQIHIWVGYLTESRYYPSLGCVLISEEELFGIKKRTAKSKVLSKSETSKLLNQFRDLKEGDYVVHKDFGIGKYLGLKSMTFQDIPNDYVLLEYQDGDKLYIPIYRLNILQKYVGGENTQVRLDKLGTDQWAKAKSKAKKAIAELAAELLEIQAKRKLNRAYQFSAEGQDYHQFEMEFPWDETPDQQKAIDDVSHDLSQDYAMDRLVCGDVGYGKTEIAMRAACRAVVDNKQVAVLVPTTVLAFQHYQNFQQRFKNLPVRVEMISRLRSAQEVKRVLQDLKDGRVHIVIGTHRLLSPDLQFKDLQLLIIDEEHRFGVVHKEKLKKIAESIHILSMTATPIPRTLNMAMTGIKDISIITTPPPDRLSIRTFVCRKSDEVIAEAITNELAREGQVFFVHNRIESIFKLQDELKKLLPKVRFEVAHGQMDAEVLEEKMLSFYQGKCDVLLTTAIIESGLDVPRANTIIIDQADRFGLAQLYQLRGRVGRSERRAYCYMLVPPENQMTDDSKQRLQVIQRYTDLGSGFSVASHDLEIRGAGDLLGKTQHGHLHAIGQDLYFELLEESIQVLQGKSSKNQIEPEINMKTTAFFPLDYIPDISEKVNLYRRLSACEFEDQISEIETEIKDRFGPIPEEVVNLLGLMSIKLYLKRLHVVRMNVGPKKTSLQFADTTPASPEKLVKLIQSNPKLYSISPDQKFVFVSDSQDWRIQLTNVQKLSGLLGLN